MMTDNKNRNHTESLEAQQSKIITELLDNHAQRLSMRTLKKLEDGRFLAVAAHQEHEGANLNSDGSLSYWMNWIDHHRIAFAGVILVAMISSFMVFQNLNNNETSDAFLLGADLPPEAFVDKGFEPSLNKRANI